jgi:hypothetical protein
MNRCVVIHRTGASEVQDVQPVVHQKLRGLDYRRFVVEFTRDLDGRPVTGAVYSQSTPSAWQVSDAVKKLWGRGTGATRVFDEDGHLLLSGREDARSGVGTPTVAAGIPAIAAPKPASRTIGHRVLVGSNDPATVELFGETTELPKVRLTAVPGRGWVLEVHVPAAGAGGDGSWREVHTIAPTT